MIYHAQQWSRYSFSSCGELSEWCTVATGSKSIQCTEISPCTKTTKLSIFCFLLSLAVNVKG